MGGRGEMDGFGRGGEGMEFTKLDKVPPYFEPPPE